jgi:hypothetical protein
MAQIVFFVVSAASLLVSIASFFVSRSSLKQAEHVADEARKDWKQRKWFDLYFMASEVYHSLDRFQNQYAAMSTTLWGIPDVQHDFNDLMFLIRRLHSMAVVFPKNRVIDELMNSTAVFKDRSEAMSADRLRRIFDAVEGLRAMALVDASVLG